MELGLKNKYALVTGGSHGIGRSISLALAKEGCHVAICARGKNDLEETVRAIKAEGVEAIGLRADVLKKKDVDQVAKNVLKAWGTIHILVNNVGGGGRWGSDDVVKTPEKVWVDVYNKNALAAVRFTMRFLPHMCRQKWGRVVTITSIYGQQAGGRPWFNIAKSAETALMKNLALNSRFVRDGVTFNSVAPGSIMIPDTGWEKEYRSNPKAFTKMVKAKLPLGRLGAPQEVADMAVFLCSERASFVNGASILVDGGESSCF
jgi:3-oxoacyl-[acyl-carrier protein] reductase